MLICFPFHYRNGCDKMLGTIVNAALIIIGGAIGTLFGNRISEKYTSSIMIVMGFITACIGIQGAASTKSFLVVVLSMVFGTVIGIFFCIHLIRFFNFSFIQFPNFIKYFTMK